MKCKVIVKGTKKERFQQLTEEFGQVVALQNLFDSDGSASIAGYTSDVEIANRVNALAFFTLNHLKEQSGGLSVLDMRDSDLTKSNIERALDGAYRELEAITVNAIEKYKAGNVAEGSYIAQKAYVAMKTFDQLAPKVKERLQGFGIKLSELEGVEEVESKENIYSQSAIEQSRLDSIPPQVKLFISTLPKTAYTNVNGSVQLEAVRDDIGMKQPIDFHEAYSMLSKTLSNISNYEDMLAKLNELGEEIPYVWDVYEALVSGDLEPSRASKFRETIMKPFRNAFFSAFRNSNNKFITATHKTKKITAGGETRYEVVSQVLHTNKRRLDNEIKKSWTQKHSTRKRISSIEKKAIWENVDQEGDSMADFFSKKKLADTIKKLDNNNNKTVLAELSKHLGHLGIDISVKALSEMRKNLNRKEKRFGKKMMSDTSSVASIMKSFWLNDKITTKDGNVVGSFETEDTLIQQLAYYESTVANDRTGGSFMNGEDNQVHPINLPTAASDLMDDFSNKAERFKDFLKDSMFGKFRIIQMFEKGVGMEMATFDTIYNNDKKDGTPYSSLDPLSAMATRLMLHMNYSGKSKRNGKFGWYMMPTPADRSGSSMFKMPRLTGTDWLSSDTLKPKSDLRQWLKDSVAAEFGRISDVRGEYDAAMEADDTSKLIPNYHTGKKGVLGNGGYFNNYPELNAILARDGVENFDVDSSEVYDIVEEATINQIHADIDYLEEIGLLDNIGNQYDNLKLTELASKFLPSDITHTSEIYSFIANSIVANQELGAIFNGDLAHFKASDYSTEVLSQTTQLSNANKRAGLAYTPGVKLFVGEGGAAPTFRTAFVSDVEDSSEFLEQYKEAIGAHGMKYDGIEVTDGQGLCSLDRYADILNGLGQLTPSMLATITELKKTGLPGDEIDWTKVTEVIQPVKGFMQGQRLDLTFDRIMPKNLKYSLFPMIPSNLLDNQTMAETYNKMLGRGIDELVFTTGSKIGAYNINNLEAPAYDYVNLSNEDWRMPQVIPYKRKTYENFGTQIRKLIMGNLEMLGTYGGKLGSQLQADYQNAIALNMRDSLATLVAEIAEDGKPSVKKIANKVLADVRKNAYKTTPDFIEQALQVVELADGTFDTRIPMSFPALKHKVESSLNSAVRKAVTKQTIPGFSAVQYTGLGFNKASIKNSDDLKFVRMADGKVLPAEIKVSPQYFIQSLKKKEQTPAIQEAIAKMERGELDINAFDAEVLEGVIYRIPTQAKNSALPVTIVAFTPEAQGSVICIPSEITIQSGSDYDIDKVYLEMKHFEEADGKMSVVPESLDSREGRDNMIVNTHYSVLTAPQHFKELILPNHSDTLRDLAKQADEVFGTQAEASKNSSLATQDDFRDKNQAGGVMIGVFSIANTAHALFQELGVTLTPRFENSVSATSGNDTKFVGGFENKGKGTPEGDGKDKAMRNASDGFIGESDGRKSSTMTSFNHFKGGMNENTTWKAVSENSKTVMLARNGVFKGKALNKFTEIAINNAHLKGASFVVGDMPGVDSQFVDYLLKIEADFKIYHTGNTPRIGLPANTVFSQGNGVKINGNFVSSLSLVNNQQGGLISNDHMENQTAAVDNASNPYLGSLNINTITGSAYNFLTEAGAGLNYAAKLVGSPIVRQLTKEVRKFETLYGSEGAFREALKLVSEEKGFDVSYVAKQDADVSEATLDEALDAESKGTSTAIYDADILAAFLTFRTYGNDMIQVQQALQTDNNGAHQTLAANFIHQEKLSRVKGTRANSKREKQYPNDVIDTIDTISLNRDKYAQHSMEAFEAYGLDSAISLVGRVIDDVKPVQQKILKDFSQGVTKLIDSDLRMLMNDFYTYMYLNQNTGSGTNAVSDWLDSETMAEMLVGEESVGKQVLLAQDSERRKANEDVTYIPNEFVMSLTVDLASEGTGYDLVNFNNTASRALSSEQKTTLSNELVRLFNSKDEAENTLARDLVLYSLGMDGFSRHTNSFGDYIHASIYEIITNEEGENLVDFYRNIRKDFMDIKAINTDEFMNMFLRNRGSELKGLVDLTKRDGTKTRAFLKENPNVRYFKTTINKRVVIAESRQDGSGRYDAIGAPRGIPKVQLEYQTGVPIQTLDLQEIAGDKVTEGC